MYVWKYSAIDCIHSTKIQGKKRRCSQKPARVLDDWHFLKNPCGQRLGFFFFFDNCGFPFLFFFSYSSPLAMPHQHLNTPRSTERSSSPRLCPLLSCSATPPSTHCPPRTLKPKRCVSLWARCPDLPSQAFTISFSTGEQPASLLLSWPFHHTQVKLSLFSRCFIFF